LDIGPILLLSLPDVVPSGSVPFASFIYFGLTLEWGVAPIKHQASALQALAALPSKARRGVTPEAKPQ
jgi:hypothetical protein